MEYRFKVGDVVKTKGFHFLEDGTEVLITSIDYTAPAHFSMYSGITACDIDNGIENDWWFKDSHLHRA